MTDWLVLSEPDGKRFGFRVARNRADLAVPSVDCILQAMHRLDPDVVILRIPSDQRAVVADLMTAGITLRYADTLMHYNCELTDWRSLENGTTQVAMAAAEDAEAVRRIASAGFQGYVSHYASNDVFKPDLVLQGYVEWAGSHVVSTRPEDAVWLVYENNAPVGFATTRRDFKANSVEVLLNAILPDHQSRGFYRKLMMGVMTYYRSIGVSRISISTQAWNIRVQQAWCALGFKPVLACNTFHFNRKF